MNRSNIIKKGIAVALTSLSLLTGTMGIGSIAFAETGGTVNVSGLNVRAGAGTNSQIIGLIGMGTQVTILETTGGWYKVNTVVNGRQTTGYVSAQYINVAGAVAASGGTVNATGLNVRQSPSTNAGIITVLGKGTSVTINGTEGSWYKITAGNVSGYVFAEYITIGGSAPQSQGQPQSQNVTGTGTVNAGPLNMRSGASTSSGVINLLSKGSRINILGKEGSWYKVQVGNSTGYVYAEYVTLGADSQQPAGGVPTRGVINVSQLNVRSGPGTNYQSYGFANTNALCDILEKQGDWYKVNTTVNSAPKQGWVSSAYVTVTSTAAQQPQQPAQSACTDVNETVWATETVNIRKDSNTSCAIIGGLSKNSGITRTGILSNGWSRVAFNGGTAYISSQYLTTTDPSGQQTTPGTAPSNPARGQEVVNYALQFVGNPYVYGGNSLTEGVDCSGFTQQVYKHFGYSLKRSANDQRSNGVPVPLDQIQPGDLLFYGSSTYASHVTIYMGEVNGVKQVVHASTPSTGIKISDYSYRTPFAAVRIIN